MKIIYLFMDIPNTTFFEDADPITRFYLEKLFTG